MKLWEFLPFRIVGDILDSKNIDFFYFGRVVKRQSGIIVLGKI